MASTLGTAATLQTPEEEAQLAQQKAQQAAVVTLQSEAPDAGISSTDSYDTAVEKYKNSNYYKANIGAAEQTLANLQKTGALTTAQQGEAEASAAAARASAGASAATAAQTRVLTGLMQNGGGSDANILAALKAGTLTLADLPTVVNSTIDPQGIKRITSEWIAQGGNPVATGAAAAAATENARNLGAGGYTGLTTATTNLFGDFLGGAFGSNPASYLPPQASNMRTLSTGTVTMTGPKGTYSVPSSQVTTMQNNGYSIVP